MNEPTLQSFIQGWELFRLPALCGALAGALLGVLGVYVILRRMVFMSAAVSQAASLGVSLAFYLQAHVLFLAPFLSAPIGATTLTLLAVSLLALVKEPQRGIRRDAFLGVAYLLGAAGTLIVSTRTAQDLHDIESILFGSAVAVLPEDAKRLLIVASVILLLHTWLWRGFSAVAFDADGAKVRGLPTRFLELSFFISLAVAISLTTQILGALPCFAFSVLPAMMGIHLAKNLPQALWLSGFFGALSGFCGYVVAFLYNWPVGASQTVVALLLMAFIRLVFKKA